MKKNLFKTVFTIIGTLIGAGFASGQEVYVFFFSYGIKGLIGILISSLLIGFIIYKSITLIENEEINNYTGFLDRIIKKRKLRNIMNIIVNIFILVSFYVMIAGFGAYLNQEYNLNNIIGSSILAIICIIVFKSNIKIFLKINEILIPVLILVIVIMRFYEFYKYTN